MSNFVVLLVTVIQHLDTTKSSFQLFSPSCSIKIVSSFGFLCYKVDNMDTFIHFGILNTV